LQEALYVQYIIHGYPPPPGGQKFFYLDKLHSMLAPVKARVNNSAPPLVHHQNAIFLNEYQSRT
jgi:hypothetical protein